MIMMRLPRKRLRLWLRSVVAAWAAILLLAPVAARAEYQLDAGDVLEISVFGVQDFKRRTTVNVDGVISVPLVGDLQAAGLSLPALRARLTDLMITKNVIRGPDVTVELVEHRPFYINGDVARPGAHPYKPGITVRHAVALAGGYDIMRFKVDNPLLAAAELRSQYENLWTEFVRRQARVTSLQAELDGKKELDLKQLEQAPIAQRIIMEIALLESNHFKSRLMDQQKEKEYLNRAIKLAENQVSSLFQGQQQEELGVRAQSEGLERTTTLHAKGLAPATRLTDEQRTIALLRSRQLETGARLAQAQQTREEYGRRLERADDDRKMRTLRELQDALVELERVRHQLQAIGEKLLYTGAIKAQLSKGGRNEPEIAIFRKMEGEQVRLAADENTEILPGDVVDVVIRHEYLMVSP